jgi:hypothetical protein
MPCAASAGAAHIEVTFFASFHGSPGLMKAEEAMKA